MPNRNLALVEKILPKRLLRKLADQLLMQYHQRMRGKVEGAPCVDLPERHICHARLLPDRKSMLELLPKGGHVVEAGVAGGDFSAEILARNRPASLTLIDLWDTERYSQEMLASVTERFADQMAAGQVKIERGFSTHVAKSIEDSSLDWVYIDTDHTYPTTRDELMLFSRKVRPGGILAGHDYVSGNWESLLPYGVISAVHEFCLRENWEIIYLTVEQRVPRSFAIRRINE